MKVDKTKVIGVKLYIGAVELGDIKSVDFVDNVQFKMSADEYYDETGLFNGDNKMTCKYFDDDEGVMYVTFDREIDPIDLPFFSEDELIFKKVEE